MDVDEFNAKATEAIPANVRMFSGCQDCQTSADVFNVSSFDMPSDAGPGGAGGACTNALLSSAYANSDISLVDLLKSMRDILGEKKYSQVPQLSSSRKLDLTSTWTPLLKDGSGVNRALLIGINYVGSNAELKGCHNDVVAMKTYLISQGFREEDMKIYMDDGIHENPTYDNIVAAFEWLVETFRAGDNLFFHYSGHGGNEPDDNGDEKDGRDETLIPVDYQQRGQIRDDLIYQQLVVALPAGVQLTACMDCCHSGTVFDLPYIFVASQDSFQEDADTPVPEMTTNPSFSFQRVLKVAKKAYEMYQKGAGVQDIALTLKDEVTEEDKAALSKAAKGCLG
eukprot:gene19007-22724_t